MAPEIGPKGFWGFSDKRTPCGLVYCPSHGPSYYRQHCEF